jgi:hypothetical protein
MYEDLVQALRCCGSEDRCKGCPRENAKTKCYDDICIEAADAIAELSRENESLAKSVNEASEILRKRWIPVTERLPELNAPCLVYNKSQPMMVGWRIDDKRFRIPGSFLPDHPTHWMPLPEPPKEE